MHRPTLLERSYLTRTTMKQTNFSQRFDKPDFNLQKGYRGPTHSQNLGHIRIQSEIITHIRTAFSFRLYFNTSRNLPNKKNESNCKIAFNISKLISKSIFVNLPTQELQKIAKAVTSATSMDQNLPIEQTHFFSTSGRL